MRSDIGSRSSALEPERLPDFAGLGQPNRAGASQGACQRHRAALLKLARTSQSLRRTWISISAPHVEIADADRARVQPRHRGPTTVLGDQVLPQRLSDSLGSVANAKLGLRLFQVTSNGLRADIERLGNLRGLRAHRRQSQDGKFPGRQLDAWPEHVGIEIDELLQPQCRKARGSEQQDSNGLRQDIGKFFARPEADDPADRQLGTSIHRACRT